jgi:hypothetical protein
MAHTPDNRSITLNADDRRLLTTLAKFPAMWPGSPADAARLERLVTNGYLVKDPLQSATFRLTIRGWAFIRSVTPKVRHEPEQTMDH